MIFEESLAGDVAVYSDCKRYRYFLSRGLTRPGEPMLGVIMLNPSTASAADDDPTIRRVRGFAARWGYSRVVIGNMFALRSTDPRMLRQVDDPIGPLNDGYLARLIGESDRVLVAWGSNPITIPAREQLVIDMAKAAGRQLVALRVSKSGAPAHPLYMPAAIEPVTWPA
jgi:hypothetical protein